MWIESFNLVVDANNDGTISLAETWHILGWLYQLPGNLLIELLGAIHPVAHLLQIQASPATGYGSLHGGLATVASTLIWLLVLVQLANLREKWKRPAREQQRHKMHRARRMHPF